MDISEIQGTEYKTFPVQQSARLGLFLAALFLNIGGLYIVYLTHTYWGRAPLVLENYGDAWCHWGIFLRRVVSLPVVASCWLGSRSGRSRTDCSRPQEKLSPPGVV